MTATTTPPLARLFNPQADPQAVPAELRSIVEAAILNDPRSLQKRIGPSGLGNECARCLAHGLAETPESADPAWLPTIGRAVHEWLEGVFVSHEVTRSQLRMPDRFLPEHKVNVGQVGGVDITGSTDLFDTHTGTVIDFKIVGTNTLRSARANGASLLYQRQAMLYGKGWQDAGYTVTNVVIWFMPRNAVALTDGYAWSAAYDRSVAEATLARADTLARDIQARGLQAVLADLPPHDGDGFSCRKFPDYAQQLVLDAQTSADPFGG